MVWESRSVMSVLVESPAKDLFCCQKAMSDWKARNSKSRCSRLASIVNPSRYTDVSEISLRRGDWTHARGRG